VTYFTMLRWRKSALVFCHANGRSWPEATDIARQLNGRFRARAPKLTEFEMPVRPQETGPAWRLMSASDNMPT
jgi:hypothetical protein